MLFGFPEAICCSFPSPLFPSPIGANLPNPSLPQIFGGRCGEEARVGGDQPNHWRMQPIIPKPNDTGQRTAQPNSVKAETIRRYLELGKLLNGFVANWAHGQSFERQRVGRVDEKPK